MDSARREALEAEVREFSTGSGAEYAFPAELTVEERKVVKAAAEANGLTSQSLGMGADRRIHIFRPTPPAKFEPIAYAVKNTFVDGPVDPQSACTSGPSSQSMPAGALQQHLDAERMGEGVADAPAAVASSPKQLATVDDASSLPSPRSSRGDGPGSTAESLDWVRDCYSVKNTFVHIEEVNVQGEADPRIVQSMPAGKFGEGLLEDKRMAAGGTHREAEPISEVVSSMSPEAPVFQPPPEFAMPTAAPAATNAPPPAVGIPTAGPGAPWPSAASGMLPSAPISVYPASGVQTPMPLGNPGAYQPWAPGTIALLCGLTNQPGFNGLRGAVNSFDAETGRYNVLLDGSTSTYRWVKVRPENLHVIGMAPSEQVATGQSKATLSLDHLVAEDGSSEAFAAPPAPTVPTPTYDDSKRVQTPLCLDQLL